MAPPVPLMHRFTRLPHSDRHNVKAVAAWLMHNAPCVVGDIPADWTDELLRQLRNQYVPDQIIGQALADLHKRGFRFIMPFPGIPIPLAPQTPSNHATMGPAPSAGDRKRGLEMEAERLEHRFKVAEINDDAEEMAKVAQAYLDLLGGYLQATQKMMKGGGQITRDQARLAEVESLLRPQAPTLGSLVRQQGFQIPQVHQMHQRINANRARRASRRR